MNRLQRLGLTTVAGLAGYFLVREWQRRNRPFFSFQDRSVVITGGSRGLGLVMARELAAEGARLTLMARDYEELERAEADLARYGNEVLIMSCDVREQAQVIDAIEQVVRRFGRIDVLINNAGIIQVGPVEHMTLEDFEDAMAVHLWGPLYAMLAALPYMRQQGGGRIVNVTSIGGAVAAPHLAPYTASKFAQVGLSDAMRAELATDNIYVTTVVPGLMRTGSHVNAFFKGRHEDEFTWFAAASASPLTSTSAQSAARQIIRACRYGEPSLTITPQARLLALSNTLLPGVIAGVMKLTNRLLPEPADERGDQAKMGWESRSNWAPSFLTRPADAELRDNNQLSGYPLLVYEAD